jgi:hypothetical protein
MEDASPEAIDHSQVLTLRVGDLGARRVDFPVHGNYGVQTRAVCNLKTALD